jgi:opacity protein-like surface antigen
VTALCDDALAHREGNTVKLLRTFAVAGIAGLVVLTGAAQAEAAPKPRTYKNCTELNKVYKGGVAKYSTTRNKGGKTRYRPTVSKKVYDLNKGRDRDKDGIACER